MTEIHKRFEQLIKRELENGLIPERVPDGILVGDIVIVSNGSVKAIWQNQEPLYTNIFLNKVTIALANLLAYKHPTNRTDQIYQADQYYGRWFIDSQLMRNKFENAINIKDYDRADILWARYEVSRYRMISARDRALQLIDF